VWFWWCGNWKKNVLLLFFSNIEWSALAIFLNTPPLAFPSSSFHPPLLFLFPTTTTTTTNNKHIKSFKKII